MILCGVSFTKNKLQILEKMGVKDSKKLSPKKREELAKIIKEQCTSYKTLKLSSQEIDEREKKRISLNKLEIIKFVHIVNELQPDIIYIDAADTDEKRFGRSIKNQLNYTPRKIISKHKADERFPIVGAASIIAKFHRDMMINELNKYYMNQGCIDIGSGYPSDEKTINFLRYWIRTHKKAPSCARKTWATTKKIIEEELYNKKITQFFK
jgi:ribonuclease HII